MVLILVSEFVSREYQIQKLHIFFKDGFANYHLIGPVGVSITRTTDVHDRE